MEENICESCLHYPPIKTGLRSMHCNPESGYPQVVCYDKKSIKGNCAYYIKVINFKKGMNNEQ